MFRTASAVAAALVALALAHTPALAEPTPEQREVALAVVKKSGALSSFSEAAPIFLDEGKRTFSLTRPELAGELDAVAKDLLPVFEQRREQLEASVAELYAERFTAQELKDISAFYDSPAGSKLTRTLPVLQQQTYEQMRAWSQQMSQEVVTRIRQEMKKRGHNL